MTAALISGGMSLLGGILGGNSAKSAADTQAKAQLEAAKIAAESARFKPVGVTTRFGSSNFQMGPDGNLVSAGYDVSPDVAAMRDSLMSQAGGQGMALQQQGMQGAQSLFNLGQQYMAQSPQEAAQQWMQGQQALLQPGRDQAQARMTQNLFNSGRGGLSVAQGGNMGSANPEQQAYYNAMMQQDMQLAAQAQQQGRDQTDFGAGLFSTGANVANAGLTPMQNQLGFAQGLENAGQSAMTLGANLGGQQMQGGTAAGNFMMQGAQNAGNAMKGAGGSALGTGLVGLSNNSAFTNAAGNWFNNTPPPIQDQGYSMGVGPAYAGSYDSGGMWSPNRQGM